MRKKIFVFAVMFFIISNVFAYNYVTSFYNWRGDQVYKVCATDTAFKKTYHVVQINDLNRKVSRNFVCNNKAEVMNLYEILSRMNTATLEETIRSTKWNFWFEAENGWIFYSDAGLSY